MALGKLILLAVRRLLLDVPLVGRICFISNQCAGKQLRICGRFAQTSQKHLIIDAYGDCVEAYMKDGWEGYLLSFMFNQLRGNRDGLLRQMEREVERVYATLLTRVVRDPTHEKNRDLLPRWIVCPDLPVPKHTKMSLRDVTLNGGLHLQGVGVQRAGSRLKERLDEHFQRYQGLYIKAGGALRSVTATPITHKPKYVVGYGFKTVTRRRASLDDVLILPRALSEIKAQHCGLEAQRPRSGC